MINLRRNRTFGPAGSRQGREEIGEYIRGSLWVLPGTAVLVALIAGSVLSLVPVPIAWWWADESAHAGARVTERLGEHLIAAVLVGGERTLLQDAAFGMRQLVDIALKALSPAVNDPYTAVMSVERLTALLAALAPRRLGDIVLYDPDGPSRVVAHFPTFADYVDLAVGQIRRYGASEPQVAYALLRLLQVAGAQTRDSGRRQVLASHARLVLADAERTICQPADLARLQNEGETLLQTLAG